MKFPSGCEYNLAIIGICAFIIYYLYTPCVKAYFNPKGLTHAGVPGATHNFK
jgi:hypothetical protein